MALFCCSKLASNTMLGNLVKFRTALGTASYAQAASVPKITFKKFEPPQQEHHDVRNARLSRPLSPHITIYKFELPSILSITHRTTGIILTSYAAFLGMGALVLPHDISHYITMIEGLNLSTATIFLAKLVLATPFGYHFANGIRHLYWDTAKGLTIKEVYSTGYAMLTGTIAISVFLACL